MAELRKLSEHCEFEANLNDMLRDRLVCGIQDIKIQQKLLSESNVTLDNAFKTAAAMERAQKDSLQIQNEPKENALHKVYYEKSSEKARGERKACFRCGGNNHWENKCYFKNSECFKCKKIGHVSKVCPTRFTKKTMSIKNTTHDLKEDDKIDDESTLGDLNTIYQVENKKSKAIIVNPVINGMSIPMEVDTGASLSVINEKVFNKIKKGNKEITLMESKVIFKTYSGESIHALGKIEAPVKYNNQNMLLNLHVIEGNDKASLIGRDWLHKIKLDWHNIFAMEENTEEDAVKLNELLDEFKEIFGSALGLLKGEKAKIYLHENAVPKFCKARPVPYALKQKVENELERMINLGILEAVEIAEWATPVVPVRKPDNSIRLCGDYKTTVNQASKLDSYPIPKVDDLFAEMTNCVKFSKLDLKHAYQQMELDEDSKNILTLNTHKGLYRPTRLAFGVKSATGIFQRAIEKRLKGIPNTVVRVDDILVGGKDVESKLKNLRQVFQRLKDSGLKLRKEKCVFMKDSVVYLGMQIDKNGITPVKEKIRAIVDAPPPSDVSELKSFLGMLNYYHRHLPNAASILEPLHQLLRSGVKWKWGAEQKSAFEKAKTLLTSADLLIHYDPEKPLILACDASPYGVGAVLSHIDDEGLEKPIAYASKTLNSAERNYAQVEKEGLAVIFGIKKFHQYCFGRPFTILSDHKPLEGLLGENKPISGTCVARMQRWAVILSSYDYQFKYREGSKHGNADALSRLPLKSDQEEKIDPDSAPFEDIMLLELDNVPITAKDIQRSSQKDSVLRIVLKCISTGSWAGTEKNSLFKPFYLRRNELSVDEGCVLWGSRVVIPRVLHNSILEELHDCHPGMNRMKALARSYVWWPGMDGHIEKAVRSCHCCQANQKNTGKAPIHPWEWTNKAWVRIHIDHAGPYLNKMFLIIIDSYSKWLDIIPTTADSADTIRKLRTVFANHGLPEQCVSDNGSPFTSEEFEKFLQINGIKQIRTSPYHPSSNGMAERMVQTFKNTLKKMSAEKDVSKKLQKFLFTYRITPQTTTGKSPAELLMGRKLVSTLDLVRPNLDRRIREKQSEIADDQNRNRKLKEIQLNDPVYVRNFGQGSMWWKGKIVNRHGPLTWLVQLEDGRVIQRHTDHVRVCHDAVDVRVDNPVSDDREIPERDGEEPMNDQRNCENDTIRNDTTMPKENVVEAPAAESISETNVPHSFTEDQPPVMQNSTVEKAVEPSAMDTELVPRRSTRNRKPPDYYGCTS